MDRKLCTSVHDPALSGQKWPAISANTTSTQSWVSSQSLLNRFWWPHTKEVPAEKKRGTHKLHVMKWPLRVSDSDHFQPASPGLKGKNAAPWKSANEWCKGAATARLNDPTAQPFIGSTLCRTCVYVATKQLNPPTSYNCLSIGSLRWSAPLASIPQGGGNQRNFGHSKKAASSESQLCAVRKSLSEFKF